MKNKQTSYIPHRQKLKTSPLRLGKRRYLRSVLQLKILLVDITIVAKQLKGMKIEKEVKLVYFLIVCIWNLKKIHKTMTRTKKWI